MKRILSLIMSVMITVSSFSCATATQVYADTIVGNYVSMGVMISLLFSAYGIQRTIDGSKYINDLIQQCAQEASETGFGMLKNGIQSIGVTIQNGVSYVQKSFAEWVYNWALEKNIFDVSQEVEPQYYTFEEGTYTINSGITFNELADIIGMPSECKTNLLSNSHINANDFAYITHHTNNSGNQTEYRVVTIPSGTVIEFRQYNNVIRSVSSIMGARTTYNPLTGVASNQVFNQSSPIYNTGVRDPTGSSTKPDYDYNGLNGSIVSGSDLDYGVTSDIPDVSEDLDSYASDWVNHGITVDQDDYLSVTLPIDSAGTAVGVVEGTGEAINTAGVMDQYDVRDGTISADAIEDLEQAVADSEAEEELKDDLSIQGLETVFPFCLPWDFAAFIGLLKDDPVAPRFELEALNADGETISYTFDLSMFDSVAVVCRNMELLAFIIALILITKGFFV